MDKKKIIIIGSIVAIILSVAVVIYATSKPDEEPDYTIDGINLPTNEDILKDAAVDNLTITDVSLLTRDGISTFKATISNQSDIDINIDKLYVIFYEGDNQNKTMALYDTKLSIGNETYINITSETDLTNTTKIEYVLE